MGRLAKLLPKAVPRSCFPKLFSKAPLQSGCPKAAMLQTCSPKLVSKATPESCSPKFFKVAVQSCSSKLLPKAAPHSCSPALLHKVVPKAVRCPKAAESCSPKLLLPEAASWSGKLSKVAPQSCYPNLFPGAAPQSCAPKLFSKAVTLKILQTCSPKRLPKAILHSGSRKLRLKVATRSYCPKLLPQNCNLSNLYAKTAPQS